MPDDTMNLLPSEPASDEFAAAIDRLHALRVAGDYTAALILCDDAIRRQPDQPHGYLWRSGTLNRMGRLEEALACCDKVVELAPDREYAYYVRADLLFDLGRYSEAIADFTRSAELDHSQFFGPLNFLYRAECHFRLGNYDAALADCALVPDDFDFPGFRDKPNGSKQLILADIERITGKPSQPTAPES